MVAEYGRQPWIIEGVLPTFLAASPVPASNVWISLVGFVLFYTVLLVVDLYLMIKYARLGPSETWEVPDFAAGRRRRAASWSTARRCARVRDRRSDRHAVPIDYEILRVIWWALLGILLIGFAIFDGFDLGTAILLPFVGRTDMERRLLINSVGPVWEGNQVWFILGGGAASRRGRPSMRRRSPASISRCSWCCWR